MEEDDSLKGNDLGEDKIWKKTREIKIERNRERGEEGEDREDREEREGERIWKI